jgi:hypothetical protein
MVMAEAEWRGQWKDNDGRISLLVQLEGTRTQVYEKNGSSPGPSTRADSRESFKVFTSLWLVCAPLSISFNSPHYLFPGISIVLRMAFPSLKADQT